MISAMFTGAILTHFEEAFAALPILVTFIPMLTDTGGNSGSQASTLVIRGMALNEIATKDFFKVLVKELGVSVIVGFVLAFVNLVRIIIFNPGQTLVGVVVAFSVLATVIIAKSLGAVSYTHLVFFIQSPLQRCVAISSYSSTPSIGLVPDFMIAPRLFSSIVESPPSVFPGVGCPLRISTPNDLALVSI